ncbi:MAG TPA: toast rack family protein [Candidatus Acidoferrum sp.]|nr:toast rack family protein [Candidatus Acidoferrum sp.]
MPDRQQRIGSSSVVFPLLLIGFGVLMLLWRWLPNFYPWGVLGKYWPLLFICIGAGMVWDRTRIPAEPGQARPFPLGSALGTVVFLAIMAGLIFREHAFYPRPFHNVSASSIHESKTIDRGTAKAVHMSVEMAEGELIFEGGGDHLLSADFYQDPGWPAPQVDYAVNGDRGELKIHQEGNTQFVTQSNNRWTLTVDDSTPLDLKVDVGAGRGEFHLAKVDLTSLELNIGAGQAEVDLTGERLKDLRAEIQGGVGQAVVKLPRTIGVVAEVHGGLGSIDVHGLKEEDGKYVNAAFGKSPNTIHLTIEGGIGQIKLEQE